MHPLLARKLAVAALALAAPASLSGSTPLSEVGRVGEETRAAGETALFMAGQPAPSAHSFYFTRAAYPSGGNGRGGGWGTDWPTADHTIIAVLGRLTNVDIYPREHSIRLDDPDLGRYPFIYAVEVGSMNLRDFEAEALRRYLLAGGFLMVDDFWGEYQWANFREEMEKVLPGHEIVDIPLDHPIFTTIYQVNEIVQVPVVNSAVNGGPTYEQGGIVPHCMGIFDEKGRLVVVVNWNTDLGDAWEHAENPRYPLHYSTYAYQMAANFIFYAMTR